MTVLIVTNKLDFPSDEIIKHIQNKGVKVFRLNTEDFCLEFNPKIRIDNYGLAGNISSLIRTVDFGEVKSVFFRRPKRTEVYNLTGCQKEFVETEISAFLNWLWGALDCFWVSKPLKIRAAESKIDQLRIAPKFGFTIPKTIITNNPETVREFYHECGGKIINKVLAKGMFEIGGETFGIYTHRVEKAHLEILDSIRFVPCVFQERVEKRLELRVTVVGQQVFAAEIHSQSSQKTKDDWRRYDTDKTPHKVHILPTAIEESCLKLTNHYGLAFGAIDIVVTPKDEYIFLEINPNGQWLWIEKLTGLPISEAIADMLIRGAV